MHVFAASRFGQSPIDHDRLAELSDHDVVGFDIAMNDSTAVGVGHGLAQVDEVR